MAAGLSRRDSPSADPSPWPFLAALGLFLTLFGAILWMNDDVDLFGLPPFVRPWICVWGGAMTVLTLIGWGRDAVVESFGEARARPLAGLAQRYAVVLALIGETMILAALVWAYGDAAWFRAGVQSWPPPGMAPPDPFGLPLLATLLLPVSIAAGNWAIRASRRGDGTGLRQGVAAAALLAVLFTALVLVIEQRLPFAPGFDPAHLVRLADPAHVDLVSVFGALDAIYGTVFHLIMIFVIIRSSVGAVLLLVAALRAGAGQFTARRHFGLTAAVWYWYFGVGVWLFLYFVLFVMGYAGNPGG